MTLRFVITGASGFVGSQLVPRLKALGCDLLLVGRDTLVLGQIFPEIPNCNYEEIANKASRYDALIHLTVLNNNVQASANEFIKVNVELLSQVVMAAKAANVQRFVNVTSFHAFAGSRSAYADSKRQALQILEKEEGLSIVNVFLPVVYGDDFTGKLSIVKKMPLLIRPAFLILLTALLPTLHVDRLASFFVNNGKSFSSNVMLANPQEQNPVYRLGKRSIDLLFSVTLIGLFGWFLLVVWFLVRATSSGPGIFAQERVGLNGKPFTCYKFRTMWKGTRQAGTHQITSDALTPFGVFLRKTKIDELPQAWNILRGEMSLVGPRPCLPSQQELSFLRSQFGVLHVLPGVTGLAQINGVDMSDPEKLTKIDARYVAQRGLLMDLKLVIVTLIGRGYGDNVMQ